MRFFNRTKKPKKDEQKPEPQKASEPKVSSAKRLGVDTAQVIVKPLVSEKTANLAGANQYVFVVRKDANRIQVRAAIRSMYGVSPLSINILNVRGKKVRFGRSQGTRSAWKKAIITLPAGQSINVYEGV